MLFFAKHHPSTSPKALPAEAHQGDKGSDCQDLLRAPHRFGLLIDFCLADAEKEAALDTTIGRRFVFCFTLHV